MIKLFLTVLLACLIAPAAWANSMLIAEDVLARSAKYHPQILQSLAERRQAQGTRLAADGAFDLVFSAETQSYVTSFYDGQYGELKASRNLRPLGASVYGSYRMSQGNFPVYEDENFTNEGGEFKIGALFSLLRDRAIDARRFGVTDAEINLRQAELEVLLTRIGVQHQALRTYWVWVARGHELQIYKELLTLAETRQTALENQVRRGALAEIFLTENQQNITRRQIFVRQAQRDYEAAANALAFYYRGEDGAILEPIPAQLPPRPDMRGIITDWVTEGRPLPDILSQRPDLAVLQLGMNRARARVTLAENDLKPRLDLSVEASKDVGNVAEGGFSRDEGEVKAGLRFSIPFEMRTGRGRLANARANLDRIKEQERLLEDRIAVDLRAILLDLNTASDVLALAAQEVTQADELRDAEVRRFDSGASDFFVVNVREETAANARIRYIEAELTGHIARANYDAAVVDLDALGL